MRETPAPGRLAAALPLATAIASTFALIAPVLSPRLQLHYRDTGRLYYPVKQYIAERLARGEFPLWDPWTDAGISLLGQISPGLLHPFTLLYLFLPFDLAFKLNHVLALPLAAAGAYWLARRLGTAPWPSAIAGVIFGCSGYLVSTTASNLPYALGPASIPAACAGLLWFCERPGAKRLLGASALLALCNYSGEPQSALLAAVIGGACALGLALDTAAEDLRARMTSAARAAGLAALWAAVGLAISMPAVLPGGLRARHSQRWNGITAEERALFAASPLRLFGLAVPRAFDDTVDERQSQVWLTPFWEYFDPTDRASFADAICVGIPALLLALFAFFSDRRGRWLALGALVFVLAATGEGLGVHALLSRVIPGFGLFRYAEKMIAPASLLIALAAARGAERGLATSRRAAAGLLLLSGASGAAFFTAREWLIHHEQRAVELLVAAGRLHAPLAANEMLDLLEPALSTTAFLSCALALVALHRSRSPRGPALSVALACACCFAAAMTYASDLLFTANVSLFHTPPKIVEELVRRAGPSENHWRFVTNGDPDPATVNWPDHRFSATASEINILAPQFEALFHIEGVACYFSLLDEAYRGGLAMGMRNFHSLFDVRFVMTARSEMSERRAKLAGFDLVQGAWLRENPPQPRAFLVAHAYVPPKEGVLEVLADPGFSPHREAVLQGPERRIVGKIDDPGTVGEADYQRLSPEKIDIETNAPANRLLVVAEHYDDGWRARVDGQSAPVVAVDIAAIGVPVPAGPHRVELRFWPTGLTAGLWIACLTLALLALWIAIFERGQRRIPSTS